MVSAAVISNFFLISRFVSVFLPSLIDLCNDDSMRFFLLKTEAVIVFLGV